MKKIHPPENKYPKLVKYIRTKELAEHIKDGWKLVSVNPLMTSVKSFLVEKSDPVWTQSEIDAAKKEAE